MNDALPLSSVRTAGRLETVVQKLFARSVKVINIVDINGAFRLITFAGDALRGVAWTPGDKIQLQLGGWVQRTYTPIDWDAGAGSTRILVYLHAGGPGAEWARQLRAGVTAVVFGPRKSLQLASGAAAAIVCGDETSLGLAAALSRQAAAPLRVLLEVGDLAQTLPVLRPLGLDGAQLCVRKPGDGHLPGLAAQLSALLQLDASAVVLLTGRASTIQYLGRALKGGKAASGKRYAKAYWAEAKTGLD